MGTDLIMANGKMLHLATPIDANDALHKLICGHTNKQFIAN